MNHPPIRSCRVANLRRASAVLFVAVTAITVAACRDGRPTPNQSLAAKSADTDAITTNAAASVSVAAALPSVSPPVSHELVGRRFSLSEGNGRCWLETSLVDGEKKSARSALDLAAPCYFMLWQALPPRGQRGTSAQSDGIPIGTKGEPIAWRYPGAQGQTVVVFIGDPIAPTTTPDPFARSGNSPGARCANSMQAILIPGDLAGPIKLSAKVVDVGGLCAESGMDEKTFWLFAHR